jgi:hypothetical protein
MRREPAEIRHSRAIGQLMLDQQREGFDRRQAGGVVEARGRRVGDPPGAQTPRPASVSAPLSVKRETNIDFRREGGAGPSAGAGGGMGGWA